MGFELETVFKFLLYLIVVLILVAIMVQFKDKILNLCLLPSSCEKENRIEKCGITPTTSTESTVTKEVLEKYCNLCWEKNKRGECKEMSMCYVISLEKASNPTTVAKKTPLSSEVSKRCSILCSRDATSLFVQYDWINENITIGC